MEELDGSPGLDAADLGERVGLHPNTVRWHLGILRDAGLVESRPEQGGTPGRPRILYALRPGALQPEHSEHRLLATMLTGVVAEHEDAEAVTERVGRAWGRYLVRRASPLAQTSREAATAEVATLLAEQGFEPEVGEGRIDMHRCPFHELAETHPHVVCSVHRGLVAGALEELGSDLEVAGLDVFPRPDVCVLRLATRSGAAEAESARSTAKR